MLHVLSGVLASNNYNIGHRSKTTYVAGDASIDEPSILIVANDRSGLGFFCRYLTRGLIRPIYRKTLNFI